MKSIETFSSTDDIHWVIDTDYDNYAVHYSCRQLAEDGTCADSYSFIFSRHASGLRQEDKPIVSEKKAHICLTNKYRRVEHNGECAVAEAFCNRVKDRPRLICVQPFVDI